MCRAAAHRRIQSYVVPSGAVNVFVFKNELTYRRNKGTKYGLISRIAHTRYSAARPLVKFTKFTHPLACGLETTAMTSYTRLTRRKKYTAERVLLYIVCNFARRHS